MGVHVVTIAVFLTAAPSTAHTFARARGAWTNGAVNRMYTFESTPATARVKAALVP